MKVEVECYAGIKGKSRDKGKGRNKAKAGTKT
jgi:hypothetical protein